MDDGGRVQNLKECSVRIFHTQPDEPDGTGIAVWNRAGEVVIATCAHVVQTALLGVHPRDAGEAEIGVYFPQVRAMEEKARRALVVCCLPNYDDDIVLLRLIGEPAPLAPEQVAVLGYAEHSWENSFRSYGFPSLGDVMTFQMDGKIQGPAEIRGARLQKPLVQLHSETKVGFLPGMSGAAVLDTERNLVVGLVSDRWKPDPKIHTDVGWGVDAHVLTFDPFNLELRDTPLPRGEAPQPKTDTTQARAVAAPDPGYYMQGAPEPLQEWVGRMDLLSELNIDWVNPEKRVTGLIGFGGEGKSSLARQWLDNLLHDSTQPQPDGVFWWPFYDRRNVEEFFEAALKYLGGGLIDPAQYKSSNAKVQTIGAMLGARRYLFVLDGLEVIQREEGDRYGLLDSADLRDLLTYFAAPGHASFCLITSRAPVFDLIEYTSYTHRDVDRLSPADGRALLRKMGVTGLDTTLDKIVEMWDGHALTLSLLGSLLVEEYGGDVAHLPDISEPEAEEPRYQRVHRILRRYDEHLNDAERAFLKLFSVFRLPVPESAFDRVFRTETGPDAINAPLVGLDDETFAALVHGLQTRRLIRCGAGQFTTHPLVRSHYQRLLEDESCAAQTAAHKAIAEHYQATGERLGEFPTLDDLQPYIEVVHHLCRAGAYDRAESVRWQYLSQYNRHVITQQLSAFETYLNLLSDFLPNQNFATEPQVKKQSDIAFILNDVGLCLMNLGQLAASTLFFERSCDITALQRDYHNSVMGYGNLISLFIHLGRFAQAANTSAQALAYSRQVTWQKQRKADECYSLMWVAWIAHLSGEMETSDDKFRQVEALQREIEPEQPYLYSHRGILHADHLRRTGEANYARQVTFSNLRGWVANYGRKQDEARCCRVLGDLDTDAGIHNTAQGHYERALVIARSIDKRDVLIEALIAYGRWQALHGGEVAAGKNLLDEALGYCTDSGYVLYEADARVALAQIALKEGDTATSSAQATQALAIGTRTGYHWAKVDAQAVMDQLGSA